MDFDEYDYLEQTVENPGVPKGSENGGSGNSGSKRDRSEKSARHREDGHADVTDNRSNRERWEKRDRERRGKSDLRHSSRDDGEPYAERNSSRHRRSPRASETDHHRNGRDKDELRDRHEGDRYGRERERDGVKERDRHREREMSREIGNDQDGEREGRRRSSNPSERHRRARDRELEVERARSRETREGEREKEREREREFQDERIFRMFLQNNMLDLCLTRRLKDKKEAVEPEADPERDQRTVFAYQMPLKATERDVYEFFSRAGKVRDVRVIMDRNSRRSKGVGYVEFYDAMSVPMAIALSGQPLFGQPVMVKPSEAEKNLVQSTASAATGAYSTGDRKVYVGNLHFNITEDQLRQIFEAFGPVELVQLPIDSDTGHCKGFGFVQFAQLEHAKASVMHLNGKLDLGGRIIKVSAVSEHNTTQDVGTNAADFDDDGGGGLSLNASSRAMLMQKLDRTGTATSIVGPLGAPLVNGAAPVQPSILPIPGQPALPTPVVPVLPVAEPIGTPSECLLLKNMFDPSTETEPEFDLDIKEDVQEECSNFGVVKHIYVDKNSAGNVYLKFDTVAAASRAQQAMHGRWFARRMITATFMTTLQYDAKFKGS